jgi:hypothetical protein
MTLLSGIMGQKKRIHIPYRRCFRSRNRRHKDEFDNNNKQIQALAQVIDDILSSYKSCGLLIILHYFVTRHKYTVSITLKMKITFERRLI